jgi:integrase
VLPVQWVPAQARAIQDAVEHVAKQLALGRELRQALDGLAGPTTGAPAPINANQGKQLLNTWEAFGRYKVERTGQIKATTWKTDYGKTAKRLEAVVSDASDAKSLLTLASEAWPPGARRRQVVLQHLAAMLRWAVENDLLPANHWTPPPSLKSYVGEGVQKRVDGVPLTDDQILKLLGAIPQDQAGQRWRFCLQLMAAYGLRPVEVLHLRVEASGTLWCDYIKRSGGGSTKPRQLRALHPEWETEWRLKERLVAGDPLPPFGGGVAEAARRYLTRHEAWNDLARSGATLYGFRHGYALRAHTKFGLQPRIAAALMGHSPETHQRHYGRWVDEATIDSAMESALRYRNLTQSQSSV